MSLPAPAVTAQEFTPIVLRTQLAVIALWTAAAVRGSTAFWSIGALTGSLADPLLNLGWVMRVAQAGASFLAAVFVCMWFYGAVQHALERGASLDVGPAGTVACCLFPLVNLVMPFRITRGMMRSAALDPSPVALWQGLWVGAQLTGFLGGVSPMVRVGADLMMVGAGIVGARIIGRLRWS